MCTISTGVNTCWTPHGGMVVLGKMGRGSWIMLKRYSSGSPRSPREDRSGPTLPAGHTSSPRMRWQPVHGPRLRSRNSRRPILASPATRGMGPFATAGSVRASS